MQRFEKGQAREREIDMLQELTKQVEGHTICGRMSSLILVPRVYGVIANVIRSFGRGICLATPRLDKTLPARARAKSQRLRRETRRRGKSWWMGSRCAEAGHAYCAWTVIETSLGDFHGIAGVVESVR